MARIKEDRSSWKARGIIRRDFRHCKDGPEVSSPPKSKTKIKPKTPQGPDAAFQHAPAPAKPPPHDHEFYERIEQGALEVHEHTQAGYASYIPRHKVSGCTICGDGSLKCEIIPHITRISCDEQGEQYICNCGEMWTRRPGDSWRCPADYSNVYKPRQGRYRKKSYRAQTVRLRHGPLPKLLRFMTQRYQLHGHGLVEREAAPMPRWLVDWKLRGRPWS